MPSTESPMISTMESFGIHFVNETNTQKIGNCIFCGKEDHLFVNKQTGAWDCKVCGKKGGRKDFLTYFYDAALKLTGERELTPLSGYRNLPVSLLKKSKVAWCQGRYLLPHFDIIHTNKCLNLTHYQVGKTKYVSKGVLLYPFGMEQLKVADRQNENVYFVEGFFNKISLEWLLEQCGILGTVIGLPGANNFKADWVNYFTGRKIIFCLDHDGAGISGFDKLSKMLQGAAHSIKKVYWPEEYPPGYDINDMILAYGIKPKQPLECYSMFLKLINVPPSTNGQATNPAIITARAESKQLVKINNFNELIHVFESSLDLNNDFIRAIKIMLATAISSQVRGTENVWMFLVGPPGYGKTALLTSLKMAHSHCYFQSSLRRHSLISGMRQQDGADPSLLPKLNNKCLVLKDYTEVLSKCATDRDEIFGILRGAYDGSVERDYGNGIVRKYENLKFSMLAGVTKEIQSHSQASLGERFLKFNFDIKEVDSDKQQEMALKQAIYGDEAREDLQIQVADYLNKEWDFSIKRIEGIIPAWFYGRVKPLGRLIAYLRTPVVRYEGGMKRDTPIYAPQPEAGNRIAIQLQKLAISMAILEDKETIDEGIYFLLKRIAIDTITNYSTDIVSCLIGNNKCFTRTDIANNIALSESSIYYYIEDLLILGIIERGPNFKNSTGKNVFSYKASDLIQDLWKRACL